MDRKISLVYKKPIKTSIFCSLFILLFLLTITAIVFFPPSVKVYRPSIFHYDTPQWLLIFSVAVIVLLACFFLINRFAYFFFVFHKLIMLQKEFGLPINVDKFIATSGISREWLGDMDIRVSELDKKQIVKVISIYNFGKEKWENVITWQFRLIDIVSAPVYGFFSKSKFKGK